MLLCFETTVPRKPNFAFFDTPAKIREGMREISESTFTAIIYIPGAVLDF